MKNPCLAMGIALGMVLVVCIMPQTPAGQDPSIVLPEGPVTMVVTHDGDATWFQITLSEVYDECSVTNGTYEGWCANKGAPIQDDTEYSVNMISSYSLDDAKWRSINYILNNKKGDKWDVQEAIWNFTNSAKTTRAISLQLIAAAKNNSDFYPITGQICGVILKSISQIQDTLLELTVPAGNGTSHHHRSSNHAPTASARAGEPYSGFTGLPILFDASQSYDLDGSIVSYAWNFGDGMNGTGKTVSHIYVKPAVYKVQLTVTDDDGATASVMTQAAVLQNGRDPSPPDITGELYGKTKAVYNFSVFSVDPDGGNLTYLIDWGDGSTTTTAPQAANTSIQTAHTWSQYGEYWITASTIDNTNRSSTFSQHVIYISFHYVGKYGYLIDTNGSGNFNSFFSNLTNNRTAAKAKTTDQYLIDSNGDGTYDILYTVSTGTINQVKPTPTAALNLATIGILAVVVLVISLAALFTVFWLHLKRKKRT